MMDHDEGRAAAAELVAQAQAAGVTFEPDPSASDRYRMADNDVGSHTVDDALIRQKLIDAEVPGAVVEFDPEEADRAGAFVEDALSEEDAREAEEGLQPDPSTPDRPAPGIIATARAR